MVEQQAAAQFGLLTRAQALEAVGPDALRRWMAAGVLVRFNRGVYRLTGAPLSWRQRALGQCLSAGPGAVVSDLGAAYLWQARSVAPPKQIQLTLPPQRRSSRFEPPPRRVPLPPVDVTDRWGIPTTTPARTVIDLSRSVAPPLLEHIVDDLVRQRHLHLNELEARMSVADPLPRYRSALVRALVDVRRDRGVGASPREDWMVDALLAGGVQMPVRNFMVYGGGRWFEIDLAYPEAKVGIEYDGLRVHSDFRHFHSDREKSSLLQLYGWLMLQVTATWTSTMLVDRVSAALGQRARSGMLGR
jgi:hypothetical protein